MADPTKKPFRLGPEQIKPIATDMITCGGRKVAFMYREATERDLDSGWRFMSGAFAEVHFEPPADQRDRPPL